MPGKWTEQAERDLIFAVLASHTGGDLKVKVSWDTIKEQMHAWGHTDFTKDAMNQRWSKTIVKDFKEGKGEDSFGASTPAKDTATTGGGGGGAPAGRKRKTATPRSAPKSAVVAVDDDDEGSDEEQKKKKEKPAAAAAAAAAPAPKKRKPTPAKRMSKAEHKTAPQPKVENSHVSIFGDGGVVKRETADEA